MDKKNLRTTFTILVLKSGLSLRTPPCRTGKEPRRSHPSGIVRITSVSIIRFSSNQDLNSLMCVPPWSVVGLTKRTSELGHNGVCHSTSREGWLLALVVGLPGYHQVTSLTVGVGVTVDRLRSGVLEETPVLRPHHGRNILGRKNGVNKPWKGCVRK